MNLFSGKIENPKESRGLSANFLGALATENGLLALLGIHFEHSTARLHHTHAYRDFDIAGFAGRDSDDFRIGAFSRVRPDSGDRLAKRLLCRKS